MKGFLIKDFRLLLQRKKLFAMYFLMALAMSCTMDYHFVINYFSMLALIMAYSTLSYDSYDNGMAFLMTMPNARKNYVKEKYLLFAIVLVTSWFFSYLISVVISIVKYKSIFSTGHAWFQSAMIMPVFMILCSVTIPVMLKYGVEKGRIVLALVFGVLVCIVAGSEAVFSLAQDRVEPFNTFLRYAWMGLEWIMEGELLFIMIPVVIIASFVISFLVSNRIMQKKEF